MYLLSVDNGDFIVSDTIEKIFGALVTVFEDDCDDMENWTSSGWNITTNDFETALASLKEISKLSNGETLLVPIGGNIMIRVSFLEDDKVLVNVGSGVVVEKSFNDAISYLEEKVKLMREELKKRANEYQTILQRMSYIEGQVISRKE